MTRRALPGQAALFDLPRRQAIHIGLAGLCVVCRVSLAALAGWDDCWCCWAGLVEPVPPGAVLAAVAEPETGDAELEEAA